MKTDLNITIESLNDAICFLNELIANEEYYHPEEEAKDIIWEMEKEQQPTPEECNKLDNLIESVYQYFDVANYFTDMINMAAIPTIGFHSKGLSSYNAAEINKQTNIKFEDGSWHNDLCDSIYNEELGLYIYLPNNSFLEEPADEFFNTFLVKQQDKEGNYIEKANPEEMEDPADLFYSKDLKKVINYINSNYYKCESDQFIEIQHSEIEQYGHYFDHSEGTQYFINSDNSWLYSLKDGVYNVTILNMSFSCKSADEVCKVMTREFFS